MLKSSNHTSRNFINLSKLYKVFIPSVVFLMSGIIITGASLSASAANSAEVNLSATVEPSLNVTVPVSTVTLNLNPVTENLATQTVPVTVGTNNEAGYTLTMTAASTALTRDDSDGISATIDTLEPSDSGYTSVNFMPNRWGYSKNGGNFFPFATSTELASSDTKVNDDTTTLAFAAKADYAKPAGEYSLDLTFTATANPNIYNISNATYMQNVSSKAAGGCPDSLAENQVYHLVDIRDDKTYYVARLKDGNCWMLDNLRLDPTGENVKAKLTPATTNASDTALGYLKNGGTSIPSPYTQEAVSKNTGYFADNANSYTKAAVITQYANQTTTDYGNGQHYIGVYYNYCAASAGSYCYASGSGSGNASEDICPAGWRMPTGGASGEYQALCDVVKGSACSNPDTAASALVMRAALSIPLSGNFGYYSSANDQGSGGYFWSSTYNSGTIMYSLAVTSSIVYPQIDYARLYGFSVRCVLK